MRENHYNRDIPNQDVFIDYIDVSLFEKGSGDGTTTGGGGVTPPVNGRISDSLFLYCPEAQNGLFTATNKYYPCVGSETFFRNVKKAIPPSTHLTPFIANDHLDFTMKDNIKVRKLNFNFRTPAGNTLKQSSKGPTRPFRNFFFTVYISNGMASLKIVKDEQTVFLSPRVKAALNNPFKVNIDERILIDKIKQHLRVQGNKVVGHLKQMLIPSKILYPHAIARNIGTPIIKVDCDLQTNTIITRDGQYAHSLGYINLQRDKIFQAIKDKDEQLTVVFDHETASGTSYRFDIKETSDIKTFNIELKDQEGKRITFANQKLQITAELAISFY